MKTKPAEQTVEAVIVEQPKADDQAAAKRKKHRRRVRAVRSLLFRLIALAAVLYVLMFHIVGLTMMPNGDMSPRLDTGDLLLFYRLERNIKAQDIVVIDKEGQRYVCRVVACGGDIVDVTEEQGLIVNGNAVIESNIFQPTKPYEGRVSYPVKLETGEYFVMADLRNGGMDSRYFGPVRLEEIQGVVITLLRRNNL